MPLAEKNCRIKKKYICLIHNLKPEHRIAYPLSRKQAKKTGYMGFESDLFIRYYLKIKI